MPILWRDDTPQNVPVLPKRLHDSDVLTLIIRQARRQLHGDIAPDHFAERVTTLLRNEGKV